MARNVIKANAGFPPVPVTNIEAANLDFTFISFTSVEIEEGGTIADPKKLWEGNGGYIHANGSGNNISIPVQSMNGSTEPFSGNVGPATSMQSVFICGVQRLINDVEWVYCYFVYADDESSAKAQLNRFAGEGTILYAGLLENSEDMLEVDTPWDETPTEDTTDPNNEKPEGGAHADRGNFDANDLMLLEDMPDPEADEMGFGGLIMCYALHEIELQKISQALFLPNFWTSLKNKFEGLSDPMSFILDAVELPLPITDYGIGPFKLGGITVQDSGGNSIGCATYPYRFKKYNMGAIALKEVWGSEKDYSCTTISIFLPYVGVKELDPDIVLNCRLTLVLYVDRWNGDILYLLHASNNLAQQKYYRQENVVYRFAGNCGRKIPLGRVDNSNQIIQAVSGLAGIAAGYAMGGVVGAIGGAVPTIQNIAAGNFKPTVQTSGGVSGNTGRMDYQQAYLIIKRGVPEYPNNWRAEIGAPRGQELLISSLSGYTLFSTVYLENIECMAEEKAELERLLTTEGVIL